MSSPRLLVTGAGGSAAANFIEALTLGRPEVYVVGTDISPYHLELSLANATYLVPPVTDPGYLDAINDVIDHEHIDFIHVQPDVEVAFLAEHRGKIHAPMFMPPASEIQLCHDKMKFHDVLKKAGVGVPEAYLLDTPAKLTAAVSQLLSSHERVWVRAIRGAGSKASLPVQSAVQAQAWLDYWTNYKGLQPGDFMASQFLPGREFAWQSLWHKGQLVTSQARERVEYIFGQLTPSGQSSSPSVARTINRDDVNTVGEAAVRAVSAAPHGVYGVDMKEDESRRPLITEINIGRFYTTSNFFAHAGLNIPELYLRYGLGESIVSPPLLYNSLPDDLYWLRMVDMGYKLVKGDAWRAGKL